MCVKPPASSGSVTVYTICLLTWPSLGITFSIASRLFIWSLPAANISPTASVGLVRISPLGPLSKLVKFTCFSIVLRAALLFIAVLLNKTSAFLTSERSSKRSGKRTPNRLFSFNQVSKRDTLMFPVVGSTASARAVRIILSKTPFIVSIVPAAPRMPCSLANSPTLWMSLIFNRLGSNWSLLKFMPSVSGANLNSPSRVCFKAFPT